MDLVVFAPHRQTCISASWLSTVGDTMRLGVDRIFSYVVRGAPYRKLGRRHSRELGGTGISTRRMPRHYLLEVQVDSAMVSCQDIGSHGLRRL